MFYKKKGFPEEDNLVICTVTKILPHSIFAKLNEYNDLEGLIHISEISPGRIRNIRDFVREGKIIVCKVLRIDKNKGHIDLSLRRVSRAQRKEKEEGYKQEQKSEKLIELFAKEEKISLEEFYNKIGYSVTEEYGSIYNFFDSVLKNESMPDNLKSEKKLFEKLIKKVKEKIKLPEREVNTILTMSSTEANGIEKIKDSLNKAIEFAKKNKYNFKLTYISAPKYSLKVTAPDYKSAEKILKEISEFTVKIAKSNGCHTEWQEKS